MGFFCTFMVINNTIEIMGSTCAEMQRYDRRLGKKEGEDKSFNVMLL